MSTFATDLAYQGTADGEQVWHGGWSDLLDKPDLLQVRAPRPTLTLLTTNDGCFPLQVCGCCP